MEKRSDYAILKPWEYKCQCGRIVRLSNTYHIRIDDVFMMDSRPTEISYRVRVCVMCYHDHIHQQPILKAVE